MCHLVLIKCIFPLGTSILLNITKQVAEKSLMILMKKEAIQAKKWLHKKLKAETPCYLN